jgi:hypothetical protein
MARGWESKAVEAQIEVAEAPRQAPGGSKIELSPEQQAAARKVDALLLHRTRVLRDLETCSESRYKKTLNDGLTYLETQLAELGWRAS